MYSYDSIDAARQLRLLRLRPGDYDAPLCGELFTADVETVETLHPFDALSYVWGDNAKVATIATSKGQIPLTQSLSLALKAYRDSRNDRILWADALCINQGNNEEKSIAVGIMADAVYAKADRVQIYLGTEADDSPSAGELLTRIVEENWGRAKIRQDCYRSESNSDNWKALEAVLRRPWFRRVWVVQEFVVSKEAIITCGTWSIDAMALLRVAKCFRCELCLPLQHLFFLRSVQRLYQSEPDTTQFVDFALVLFIGKRLDATLDRDHLFAFFSFTKDPRVREKPESFRIDYDEALPSVVRRYSKGFVETGGAASLLYYAGLDAENEDLPSWIPNWWSKTNLYAVNDPLPNWPGDASCGLTGGYLYITKERASSWINLIETFSDPDSDDNGLDLLKDGFPDFFAANGGCVDELEWVGTNGWDQRVPIHGKLSLNPGEYLYRFNAFIRDVDTIAGSLSTYPTGESVTSAISRTILCHRIGDGRTETIEEDYEMLTTLAKFKEFNAQETLRRVHEKVGRLDELLPNTEWGTEYVLSLDELQDAVSTARSHEAMLLNSLDTIATRNGGVYYQALKEESVQGHSRRSDMARALLDGCFPRRFIDSLSAVELDKLRFFSLCCIEESIYLYTQFGPLHNAVYEELDEAYEVERPLTGRKFCLTKRGYVGLVPLDAKPGDKVYVLAGAGLPVILRQDERDENSPFTRLLGCSYIHGLMSGEAASFDGFENGIVMIR